MTSEKVRNTAKAGIDTAFDFSKAVGEDLKVLLPYLRIEFDEVQAFEWFKDRRLQVTAVFGLAPLAVISLFSDSLQTAYWALAFYFSAFWAAFFYFIFPTEGLRFSRALFCFFGTAVISMSLLLMSYRFFPMHQLSALTNSESDVLRAFGFLFGVGVPEEVCKALVLFLLLRLSRQRGDLVIQNVMFYGLMSGLGFGIYEGVKYQSGANFWNSHNSGEYYLLNMLRLTSLPFIHAIWTGTSSYFLFFADRFPKRRKGLLALAVGVPAVLHGAYDLLSDNLLGLLIALASVALLFVYLNKAKQIDEALLAEGRS
jgi:protease PrsW